MKTYGIPDNFNKKVLGLMKDEYGGDIITQAVGVRSKMYKIQTISGMQKGTMKGIKKNVAKKIDIS